MAKLHPHDGATGADPGTGLGAGTRALTAALRLAHRLSAAITRALTAALRLGHRLSAAITRIIAPAARRLMAAGKRFEGWLCELREAWSGRLQVAKYLYFTVCLVGMAALSIAAAVHAVTRLDGHHLAKLVGFLGVMVAIVVLPIGFVVAMRPVARFLRRSLGPRLARLRDRTTHSVSVARGRATHETVAPSGDAPPQPGVTDAAPADRPRLSFTVDVHQNVHLAPGGTHVEAIVRVGAHAAEAILGADDGEPERAQVILLDCSGSMAYPMAKLNAAKAATAAALDVMPDGTWFAIVRGTHEAAPVYPARGLARATAHTRAEANRAVARLWAEGGTAMAAWIDRARATLATRPQAIGHAILLTDGRDESGTPDALQAAVSASAGAFRCDCRGIGTDWEVAELRRIADALLGSVDIVADPSALAADFRAMTADAMTKLSGDVTLRVWTPRGARIRFIRQVSPAIVEMDGSGEPVDERTTAFAVGAWGAEARDYHVAVEVPARALGEEMLAARIELLAGSETASALIRAAWTDDLETVTPIDPEIAHYRGQEALAQAIQDWLCARRAGDETAAAGALGRAVELAISADDDATLRLLAAVAEIDDPRAGTVRLRQDADDADAMRLDTRSTRTVRLGSEPAEEPAPVGSYTVPR
jgi:hypothetical protein